MISIDSHEHLSFVDKLQSSYYILFYDAEHLSCSHAGTVTVGLPPAWVDTSEEITGNTQRIRSKMLELFKAHSQALMPSFGDGREHQHAVEVLTNEITDLLKLSEKKLQRLSATGSSEDSNLKKNVQVPDFCACVSVYANDLHIVFSLSCVIFCSFLDFMVFW